MHRRVPVGVPGSQRALLCHRPLEPQVTAAIGHAIGIEQVWEPSRTQQDELRDGSWVNARPKTLRWGIFHAPGRLIHRARQHVVRIVEGWPGSDALLEAYLRIAHIT